MKKKLKLSTETLRVLATRDAPPQFATDNSEDASFCACSFGCQPTHH